MRKILILMVVMFLACEKAKSNDLPTSVTELSSTSAKGTAATIGGSNGIEINNPSGSGGQIRFYHNDDNIVLLSDFNGWGQLSLRTEGGFSTTTIWPNGLTTKHGDYFVALHANHPNYGSCIIIDGQKVIGPRLAAIDDATSPEDMVVKFNLLLEALRTHGLIERGPALAGK